MKRSTKALLAAAGLVTVAAASSAAYVTTKLLVETALDRKQPKIIEKAGAKISGAKIDSKALEAAKQSAEALASLETRTVEIKSHDGKTLVGHLLPCKNPKRIIIAMHGWRSAWNVDFGMIADFWHNNGCSVLYAEQRGQNSSGGDYMGFGLIERYDCLEWVNWVTENLSESLPIYLAGLSMGATTVLMAAGLDLPKNVHGIMADCGFTSPEAIWRHVADNNLHLLYSIHAPIANALCKKKIQISPSDYSTIDALKATSIPVLFIHGTDDSFVPVEMTYENYKACRSPKKLLVVPGAEHGLSYYVDKQNYEKVATEFWNEND